MLYLDGLVFGGVHVIVEMGVDDQGFKHVLGLRERASENAVVATALLEDLVARGVTPGRRRHFVIDGSKALRCAIDAVYGADNPVQRCRLHKVRNVVGHLPKAQQAQARSTTRAEEGMEKLRLFAEWMRNEHPSAKESLLEGLAETFTVNRLDLPATLRRGLCTTNVIENGQSGTRRRPRRVTNWKDASMVVRWVGTAMLDSEKGFRRVMGHEQLWMLKSVLDSPPAKETVAAARAAG